MLPYYAAAAVLVCGALLVATGYFVRTHPIRVASVNARGTPSPPRREPPSTLGPESVTGNAPWALSAVPECFRQEREAHGSAAFVRAHLPREANLLPVGSVVRSADCSVRVGPGSLTLERGTERLVVPAPSRAYAVGSGLAVLHGAAGRWELRVYRRVSAGQP